MPPATGAAILGVAAVAFTYGPRFTPPVKHVKAAAAPTAPEPKPHLYATERNVPISAPVNADTTDDIILLRWDDADESRPLWVAAHDGRSFDMLWKSGPYAVTWASPRVFLARGGDRLFLTDGTDNIHVLELATGRELKTLRMSFKIDRMCADPKSHTAWASRDDDHQAFLVDADTEAVRLDHSPPRWCRFGGQLPMCGFADHGEPCLYPSGPSAKKVDFSAQTTMLDAMDGVSVGIGKPRKPIADPVPFIVGFDTEDLAARWEFPLAEAPEVAHPDNAYKVTMANGRVYSVFQVKGGKWTLSSREPRSGHVLWSVRVPGEEGSGLSSITATADRLFVTMRRKMHVFDTADGRLLGSLD
jgi:outer membrane protein assembly factor BamB